MGPAYGVVPERRPPGKGKVGKGVCWLLDCDVPQDMCSQAAVARLRLTVSGLNLQTVLRYVLLHF
jgi:hypothetical protein